MMVRCNCCKKKFETPLTLGGEPAYLYCRKLRCQSQEMIDFDKWRKRFD